MYSEKVHRRRILLSLVFLLFLSGAVVARLADIQIVNPERYRLRALDQYTAERTRRAPRGRIFDRHGALLAGNTERPTVIAIPPAIEDKAGSARTLAPVLQVRASVLEERMGLERAVVYLKRKVDDETKAAVEQLNLKGIGFEPEPARVYPKERLAAQVVGFTTMDHAGAGGIEAKLEDFLCGERYRYQEIRDGRGRVLREWNLDEANPHRGTDVYLTLDETIQHFAEEALTETCVLSKALGGSAVVLDVETGGVLALANYPTFDPNNYTSYTDEDRRNRAIAFMYEPGSVMKVFTLSAALDAGTVSPHTEIDVGRGHYTVAGHTYRDDHPGEPILTVRQVLVVSSNVGAIRIGEMLGAERLCGYYKQFGFLDTPTSHLPGSARMSFSRPGTKQWSLLSLPSMAFGGAEVMITPLGMAAALNTVANDGMYIKPEVIRWIESPVDGTRSAFPDSVSRRVISPRTAGQMRDIMRGVTEDPHGTGSRARVEGVPVGGKTGTARKWDHSIGAYSSKKIIASFGGFLPADDPRITIYVMVDEPQGDTYGGLVAAPVFARIAEQTVDYLGIPRDRGVRDTGVAKLAATRRLMMEDTRHAQDYEPGRMPLVLGMTMGEASQAVARCGIAPRIKGSGYVIWQDPPGGVRSEPGSECTVQFAPPPLEQ